MSIDQATPQDWNNLRKRYPAIERTAEDIKAGKVDMVNSPGHYTYGNIECIDAIEESMSAEAFRGYCKGAAMKYIWRYERKGKPLEDLQKCRWYLDRLIASHQEQSEPSK
jgi:hypothetical protein